jgi:hypothetical protein
MGLFLITSKKLLNSSNYYREVCEQLNLLMEIYNDKDFLQKNDLI